MRFPADVVIVGVGKHGPFRDDIGTPREGRTYPYISIASPDGEGGDPIKATLAEGVNPDELPRFKSVRLDFEAHQRGGALKLRTYGLAA